MTRIAVLDTETTDAEDERQVVELAVVVVDDSDGVVRVIPSEARSEYVRAERRISYEAMAVHHIKPAVLEHAAEHVSATIPWEILQTCDVVAAHNMKFDQGALTNSGASFGDRPLICTWRCASHIWPAAPSHKNQVLRYWLGLEDPPYDEPPHRALPDAWVTAQLLATMLRGRDGGGSTMWATARLWSELVRLTSAPILLTTVRFGEHKGKPWSEVPYDYLQWAKRKLTKDSDIVHTVDHWIAQRRRPAFGKRE